MATRPLKVVADVDETPAIRGLKKLEDEFENVGDAADDSADDIARSYKDAGKKVEKSLTHAFKEAGGEAHSSGKEAAASFSGGFDDVADFVQETIANAFEGFGPVGAAAGLVIAGAIGASLQGLADAQERLEEARDAARDLAETLFENQGKVPLAEQVSKVFDVITKERKSRTVMEGLIDQWADFGTVLDDVRTGARLANLPLSSVLRAIGGQDGAAARDMLRDVTKAMEDLQAQEQSGNLWELAPKESAVRELQRQLEAVVLTSGAANDALSAVGSSWASADVVAKIDDISGAWQDAATDASNYFDVTDEGVTTFDWSKYLTDAETTLRDANTFKSKIVTLPADIQAEGQRVFASQGATAGLAYVTAYEKANAANKTRFENAARANGKAAGDAAGKAEVEAANRAAQSKAQGMPPIPLNLKALIDDSNVRRYTPPTVYVPWRYQTTPSGRQPI